jgi:hypothetical protein
MMELILDSKFKKKHGLRYLAVIVTLVIFFQGTAFSQDKETGSSASTEISLDDSQLNNKDYLRYSILFGSIPVTFLFGVKAWDWGSRHEFKSEREGWFGQDTSAGGSDKFGHFYAHYLIQRFFCFLFDYTEDGSSRKYTYSILTTTLVGTMIEVGDGWSSLYGFSYEDLVVDLAGVFVGALLDYFPVLDAFVGFSVDYVPTSNYRKYFKKHETVPLGWVTDYSGFRYMMNFKLAGFRSLGLKTPAFLRYITLDLGFFSKDFSSYDGEFTAREKLNPTRNWYFGFSLNFAEVMRDFYTEKKGVLYTVTTKPFEYYHVPVGYRNEKVIQ